MRPLSLISVLVVLYAWGNTAPATTILAEAPSPGPSRPIDVAPGEVLVKFRPEVPKDRITLIVSELGVEVVRTFEALHLYHVRIVSGEPLETVIRKFSLLPEVEYAEPNYIQRPQGGSQQSDR